LKLHCTQKTEVKITLSRPEKAWKKEIAKSSVDCMMGLYIWPLVENQQLSSDLFRSNIPKFVPFNNLTEVSSFHPRLFN